MVPNIFVGCNEADFVAITPSHVTYEYEIKCSRQDALMEIAAINTAYASIHSQTPSLSGFYSSGRRISETKYTKHRRYGMIFRDKLGLRKSEWVPNFYTLALKHGIFTQDDIISLPSYVGVAELVPSNPNDDTQPWTVREIRAPVKIHKGHVTDAWLFKYSRGMSLRYWESRIHRKAKRRHKG